jgi:hypothetical protein
MNSLTRLGDIATRLGITEQTTLAPCGNCQANGLAWQLASDADTSAAGAAMWRGRS